MTFRLPERAGSCVVPFGAWPGIHMLDPSQMTVAPVDDQGRSHPAAASTPTLELRRVAAGKPLPAAHHADLLCFWAGEASGLASNAVRLATSHAKERKAYGQPIGGFQAIQHWLVDMHRDEELSHSTAIWAANEGNPARRAAAATESMRLALSVVSRSVQVFGGIGFTWDFGLHYWIRHIMATRRLAAGLSPADHSAMPRSSSRPSTASV